MTQQISTLNGHRWPVTSVAFSPDGQTIISGGDDTIRLWSLSTGEAIRTLKGHAGSWLELAVTSVSVSPNGEFIASGGSDNTIRIWNLTDFLRSDGGRTRTLTGHSQSGWLAKGVRSVAFSYDGQILASGGGDKVIKLWDTATWKEISSLTGHSDAIQAIAFSPVQRTLISAASSTIKLWKLDSGDEITFTASDSPWSVSFDANGQFIVSGNLQGTLTLWSLSTGQEVSHFSAHTRLSTVNSITFSPNGRFFATGSSDKTVKLWNTTTRDLISTFTGHSEPVNCLAFSPDGAVLASGGVDKTVRLWEIPEV